jgi:hypothetical protein
MYMVNDWAEKPDRKQITETDQGLIVEGLRLLLAQKRTAYQAISEAYSAVTPTLQPFTEADFGIPSILEIISFIEGEAEQ